MTNKKNLPISKQKWNKKVSPQGANFLGYFYPKVVKLINTQMNTLIQGMFPFNVYLRSISLFHTNFAF